MRYELFAQFTIRDTETNLMVKRSIMVRVPMEVLEGPSDVGAALATLVFQKASDAALAQWCEEEDCNGMCRVSDPHS